MYRAEDLDVVKRKVEAVDRELAEIERELGEQQDDHRRRRWTRVTLALGTSAWLVMAPLWLWALDYAATHRPFIASPGAAGTFIFASVSLLAWILGGAKLAGSWRETFIPYLPAYDPEALRDQARQLVHLREARMAPMMRVDEKLGAPQAPGHPDPSSGDDEAAVVEGVAGEIVTGSAVER